MFHWGLPGAEAPAAEDCLRGPRLPLAEGGNTDSGQSWMTVNLFFSGSCELLLVGSFHYVPRFSFKGFTYRRAASTAEDFTGLACVKKKNCLWHF